MSVKPHEGWKSLAMENWYPFQTWQPHGVALRRRVTEGHFPLPTVFPQQAQIQRSSPSKSSEPPSEDVFPHHRGKKFSSFWCSTEAEPGRERGQLSSWESATFLSIPQFHDSPTETAGGQCTKRLKCPQTCTIAAAKWTHKELLNSCGPVLTEILQGTYLSGF